MPVCAHARAFTAALHMIPQVKNTGTRIDFGHLRSKMMADASETDGEVLFRYFSQDAPDHAFLRFEALPSDFVAEDYQSLYRDLTALALNPQQLAAHYLTYGRKEGRAYRLATSNVD